MAIFASKQPQSDPPTNGGEHSEVRVSLIQGIINKMDEANAAKKEAINLLDQLKGWLVSSLDRDYGFTHRLVNAIADNSPEINTTLLEGDIAKIAAKYSPQPATEGE